MDDKITDTVFEEAIQWAVVLGSGTVSPDQREAFNAWLRSAPTHETAWRRLQEIDGDFDVARAAAAPARATLAAVRRSRRRKRRAVLGGLSAIALLFVGAWAGSDYRYRWTAEVATGPAERQTLEIAGGGRVYLNARTALDIETTAEGTVVRLHEGAIVVQSGSGNAAIGVSTTEGRLQPVGTRYVVTRTEGATDLSVIAGVVSASPAATGDARHIDSGTQIRIADGELRYLPATGLRADAWAEGIIEADDARLGAVLEGLATHRHGWLLFDDDVAALRVSGVFRLDDTDRALAALQRALPIELDRMTDWVVRVRLRDSK